MEKQQLKEWVKARSGRGAWLARALGIHRQSLHQMYAGERSFAAIEAKLVQAMRDREHAEHLMRAGMLTKPTNGS